MDGIPVWASDLSAGALVTIIVLLVLTGRLIWHKVVEKMIDAVNRQLEEATEAGREQREINRHLVETNQTLSKAVERQAEAQDVILALVRAGLPAPKDPP